MQKPETQNKHSVIAVESLGQNSKHSKEVLPQLPLVRGDFIAGEDTFTYMSFVTLDLS